MKRVGIFAKKHHPDAVRLAGELREWLRERDVEAFFDAALAKACGEPVAAPESTIPAMVNLIVVLGGDGTLISVARKVGDLQTPILGINLGSLGFLTEITKEEIFVQMERVLAGDFKVTSRMKLDVTIRRKGQVHGRYSVLNDIVINKGALARIIDMETWVDDQYLTTFKADGLIISTPTGSTAYNMAAGGPILTPDLNCLVVTPICPHMLTNRPLLVSGDSIVRVEVKFQDEDVAFTADGQVGGALEVGDIVEIRKSRSRAMIIPSPDRSYFEVLRTKLHWGER